MVQIIVRQLYISYKISYIWLNYIVILYTQQHIKLTNLTFHNQNCHCCPCWIVSKCIHLGTSAILTTPNIMQFESTTCTHRHSINDSYCSKWSPYHRRLLSSTAQIIQKLPHFCHHAMFHTLWQNIWLTSLYMKTISFIHSLLTTWICTHWDILSSIHILPTMFSTFLLESKRTSYTVCSYNSQKFHFTWWMYISCCHCWKWIWQNGNCH